MVEGSVVSGGGVISVSDLLDFGVESVVMVGGVVDFPGGAIGLLQSVVSLDNIAFPGLVLALDVTGVGVVDGVFEVVVGRGIVVASMLGVTGGRVVSVLGGGNSQNGGQSEEGNL